LVDFYPLSDFDKDPNRKADIQQELDMARAILKKYRDAAPKAKMYLTYGNHEARLQRYLWKNPELECLRDLKLPVQLGLKELDIKFVGGTMDYWKTTTGHLKIGDAHVMHGDQRINGARGGARAGYAAMNTLLNMQTSVVMNHVHRLGMGYHNSPYAQLVAVEAGCMCQVPPGANWQQGFVTFETVKGKNENYHLHHIKKGTLSANGKVVSTLVRRLEEVGRQDHLMIHWEYERGECDVIAVRGDVWTYYECKCHYMPVTYLKAYDQFKRVRRFHPEHDWKFVYVTQNHVERVRL
jgi:hypothetical protein